MGRSYYRINSSGRRDENLTMMFGYGWVDVSSFSWECWSDTNHKGQKIIPKGDVAREQVAFRERVTASELAFKVISSDEIS